MRLDITYLKTILFGVFVAFITSQLVGKWFPQASVPIFIIVCIVWFLFGWFHARSPKPHVMNKNRLTEFDADTEKELIAIKSTISLSPDISIGGYPLNSFIPESSDIKELSDEEYSVIKRKFKNELIYTAPPITFHKKKWDMLIGTVAGEIYKLHLNSTFLTDEEAFRCNALTCFSFETQLGEATDKSFEDHAIHHIWDTRYGSIHLGYIRLAGTYNINISATSNAVKTYDRL